MKRVSPNQLLHSNAAHSTIPQESIVHVSFTLLFVRACALSPTQTNAANTLLIVFVVKSIRASDSPVASALRQRSSHARLATTCRCQSNWPLLSTCDIVNPLPPCVVQLFRFHAIESSYSWQQLIFVDQVAGDRYAVASTTKRYCFSSPPMLLHVDGRGTRTKGSEQAIGLQIHSVPRESNS